MLEKLKAYQHDKNNKEYFRDMGETLKDIFVEYKISLHELCHLLFCKDRMTPLDLLISFSAFFYLSFFFFFHKGKRYVVTVVVSFLISLFIVHGWT